MSQLATNGVIAENGERARAAITDAVASLGITPRGSIDLRPMPFSGTWGVASSISHALAGEAASVELEQSGALEGLSKKEAKKLTSERARALSIELAEKIAAELRSNGAFAAVEAANGYVNISFDPMVVASGLVSEVLTRDRAYGTGAPRTERVMVEHSQPNTHKVFHVGHLRNSVLGVSISRILAAAGYPVMEATYPGDIGMHVIKCLWCYERFHLGQEPAELEARGAWIGQIYVESDARLEYRKDLIGFLQTIIKNDPIFVESIDRLLKLLWREDAISEDIAYLLGRFSFGHELKDTDFHDDTTILKFWPIVGQQLRLELENEKPYVEVEGIAPSDMTPGERLDRWEELNRNIAWWPHVPAWQEEVRQTFARWEAREPALVALWQTTREWSMTDFRRIFDELDAHFDVWFFESEVEEPGKAIVKELVATGLAEISDGLTVVKIDEKLGLTDPVYRTLPILRSDGTSLYSTKDLALTKRKFEEFGIDRAVWVVDVRQSLYFKQIFKTLELWGFDQAKQAHHLPYEIVTLPEGVISSRKGRAPLYDDVKQEVLQRARQIIDEKNSELPEDVKEAVAWQVGMGSIKYTMLARDNSKIVVFDLDEALSFDGHAAPYIQYAHARACRILENAGWNHDAAVNRAALGELMLDFGAIAPAELALLQQIAVLPEEVQRSAEQYRPLLISNYVYDLAKAFNDFYHACPVIHSEEPVRSARLALVDATRQALANGLWLLGIESPSAM